MQTLTKAARTAAPYEATPKRAPGRPGANETEQPAEPATTAWGWSSSQSRPREEKPEKNPRGRRPPKKHAQRQQGRQEGASAACRPRGRPQATEKEGGERGPKAKGKGGNPKRRGGGRRSDSPKTRRGSMHKKEHHDEQARRGREGGPRGTGGAAEGGGGNRDWSSHNCRSPEKPKQKQDTYLWLGALRLGRFRPCSCPADSRRRLAPGAVEEAQPDAASSATKFLKPSRASCLENPGVLRPRLVNR